MLKERRRMARFSGVALRCVGVLPAREREARRALFDALEQALDVRLEGRQPGDFDGLDAAVLLPGAAKHAATLPRSLPRILALGEERAPLEWSSEEPNRPARGPVLQLARSAPLDARLRGERLRDAGLEGAPALSPEPGDAILAERTGDAIWLSRPQEHCHAEVVAIAPSELAPGECLRERLRDGRFLGVAALVHFLRSVRGDTGWRPPPLRACFLFDDPNLHWPTYGHLRYRELVQHADRHGYHVALATVPLDGWFVHPGAANLFRARADRLSLLVHGNNHTRAELAQPADVRRRRALLAQAMRRVRSFERRSGIPVARVMAPPHGLCSPEMARELVPAGFEALCVSRPFPWLARRGRPWLAKPPGASPLTGWSPATTVAGGLPVLLRRGFDDPEEDLPLRAFLNQPLIVYGHHGDVREGLERLEQLSTRIGRLGDVNWMSLRDIAASNVETVVEGGTLRVRMFSRRARLRLPPGTLRVAVEFPAHDGQPASDTVEWTPDLDGASDRRAVELRLLRAPAVDPNGVPSARPAHWAVVRRVLSEGRDRLTAQVQDRVPSTR
jgi:hypothetical protein